VNIFATLVELYELNGSLVRYYSVHLEGQAESEFEDFLLRHEERRDLRVQMDELVAWLGMLADAYGARAHFFRHKNKAQALPPKRRLNHLEFNNLRLYCSRINDNIVILFNGGEKTARTDQESPYIKRYFNHANRLAEALDQCLRNKEIRLSSDEKRLLFDPQFEMIL